MTAEIVVMNKLAVALAADSAVTVRDSKVYHSANKLFTASKFAPVGVMIYGAAEFMGIPWETVIKLFRSQLGTMRFDTLKEYATALLEFIRTQIHVELQQERTTLRTQALSVFERLVQDIFGQATQIVERNQAITDADTDRIVRESIEKTWSQWHEVDHVGTGAEKIESKIAEEYQQDIAESIRSAFDKLPLDDALRDKLRQIAIWTITKNRFEGSFAGLVLTGYGETEIFPRMEEYRIQCRILGWLKATPLRSSQINSGINAYIGYFAQGEMVATFMEGMDPSLRVLILGFLDQVIRQLPVHLVEELRPDDRDEALRRLETASTEALRTITDRLDQYTRSQYISPVLDAVALLPKDELAAMAEALVNLTSFKRRVTLETETVGGPIDVAVISRGDGFIWIKRKHYFQPELNQHFFANYFR